MIPEIILPVVRRAILDLLLALGSSEEQSDDALYLQLIQLRHRLARRDVAEQLRWLAEAGLVDAYELGPYLMVRLLPDGIDAAEGRLRLNGVDFRVDRPGTARL